MMLLPPLASSSNMRGRSLPETRMASISSELSFLEVFPFLKIIKNSHPLEVSIFKDKDENRLDWPINNQLNNHLDNRSNNISIDPQINHLDLRLRSLLPPSIHLPFLQSKLLTRTNLPIRHLHPISKYNHPLLKHRTGLPTPLHDFQPTQYSRSETNSLMREPPIL